MLPRLQNTLLHLIYNSINTRRTKIVISFENAIYITYMYTQFKLGTFFFLSSSLQCNFWTSYIKRIVRNLFLYELYEYVICSRDIMKMLQSFEPVNGPPKLSQDILLCHLLLLLYSHNFLLLTGINVIIMALLMFGFLLFFLSWLQEFGSIYFIIALPHICCYSYVVRCTKSLENAMNVVKINAKSYFYLEISQLFISILNDNHNLKIRPL